MKEKFSIILSSISRVCIPDIGRLGLLMQSILVAYSLVSTCIVYSLTQIPKDCKIIEFSPIQYSKLLENDSNPENSIERNEDVLDSEICGSIEDANIYYIPNTTLTYGEIELLYLATYLEAGNQDIDGCRLVCDVILNRVESDKFPNNVVEVVFQKGQFAIADKLDGSVKPNEEQYQKVKEACNIELSGRRLDENSLYFGRKPITSIDVYQHGDHYFSK